ncbi:MAG TPA: hypothetical protein VJP86_02005 [Vicinamibacterales bacterium]|jgi:hypothetical protein|nr:hypothetical protein [Vicinamibacterales bacterium]
MKRVVPAVFCAVIGGMLSVVAAPAEDPALTATLNRVGARVRDYYDHAQTILSTETVRVQPLKSDLQPEGPPRRLVYDLRVEWSTAESPDGTPEPSVVRELISVNGQKPKPDDEPECTDPRAVTVEPLFMLLPEHRRDFLFSLGQVQRQNGRATRRLDYVSLPIGMSEPKWNKDCVSVPLEGKTRGSIWVDNDTDVVIRLEEHLIGMVDVRVPRDYARRNGQNWMYLERSDYSVKYEPITFDDPNETLTLPATIDNVRVFRGNGTSRLRITQSYSNYRRFLTRGRMLTPDNN